MKIVIAQQNYHIGNLKKNTQKIIEAVKDAKSQNADLIVFSEMSICGYPARDFLYFTDFIDQCGDCINEIKEYADTIGIIVGAPARNPAYEGKDLFNSAFFLDEKKIKSVVHKTCLPTYDVFDENRYFEPAYSWNVIEFKGKRIALTICEDIWNLGDNPLYRVCPMDVLMQQEPHLMINISASPFDYTHAEDRKATIKENVLKYKLPLIYCNSVGSQTEIVFDGASLAFGKDANLYCQLPQFEEKSKVITLKEDGTFDCPVTEPAEIISNELLEPKAFVPDLNISQVYGAIVLGLKDYFQKMGFTQAIIGSSGGIDSAVTIALACAALGKDNVHAILMPSPYSTSHSVNDAEKLSNHLKNPYSTIPIKGIYEEFLKALQPAFKDLPFNVAEENIQARTRGTLLMGIANKFGYILLNTSNKSELAVGYGTLYGDMAGGLSVLGDCYKMQVYELAKYINIREEIIPSNIINKEPSAELRPDQKDSDSLPPYQILDRILYQYIERSQSGNEIKSQGFDGNLVDRILKMVNKNEYKRNQFCPIIRISPKAFGSGRRMPIVGSY
ncbi:MAG: NAD+ synthase [Ginsengibacter sp.]